MLPILYDDSEISSVIELRLIFGVKCYQSYQLIIINSISVALNLSSALPWY